MEIQQQTPQTTLEKIYKAVQNMQEELREIKEIVIERTDDDGELTEEAKNQLEEARKIPLSEYIDHEEIVKEFSDDKE